MRYAKSTLCLLVTICFVIPSAAFGTTLDIDHIGRAAGCFFLKTDSPCGMAQVVWQPTERKRFHEGDNELSNAAGRFDPHIDMQVMGTVSWRLDFGNIDDFDWTVIQSALALFYDREIGASIPCNIQNWQKPIEGYDITMKFYTPYVRDFYRIQYGNAIARISVLTPVDGAACVYTCIRTVCDNPANHTFVSAEGVCASSGNPPFLGNACTAGGSKYDFQDQPTPIDPIEESTWGKIKSLYEN